MYNVDNYKNVSCNSPEVVKNVPGPVAVHLQKNELL